MRATAGRCCRGVAAGVALTVLPARRSAAEPVIEEPVRVESRAVDLTPPVDRLRDAVRVRAPSSVRLRDGRWTVKVTPVHAFGDAVPWEISYEPDVESEIQDFPADQFDADEHRLRVPVLKVPDDLWNDWFDDALHDVAGVHVPYMGRLDPSHILFTVHDQPGGVEADGASRPASRIEATLLVPITWSIEQAIIVRKTSKRSDVKARIEHERAHAATAVEDLVTAAAGPQTWDPAAATGRRSRFVWWWRYEKVYRTWPRYRDGKHKLAMLRTYITVLPPTRWSRQLPKPKDAITPADSLDFNIAVTQIGARYHALRTRHQREVHRQRGAYDKPTRPTFQPRRSVPPTRSPAGRR